MKTSITTRPYFVFPRVFWLKSMRSACSRSFGPSAAEPASRRGRAAVRVGAASVPHVEVVGQIPQRLHLALPQKGAIQGSRDAGRPEDTHRRPAHTYFLPQKGA